MSIALVRVINALKEVENLAASLDVDQEEVGNSGYTVQEIIQQAYEQIEEHMMESDPPDDIEPPETMEE